MLSRRKFLQISAASSGLAITGTDLLSRAVANALFRNYSGKDGHEG